MRIAICSTFPPFRGGIAQFNARMAEELGRANDVVTYTWSRQYPALLFPGRSQVEPGTVPASAAVPVLDSIAPWTWSRAAKRILEDRPDLVIVRHWTTFLAPATTALARGVRRGGVPVITIVDNAIPHERRPWDRVLVRRLLANSTATIALSDAVAAEIHDLAPRVPVQVIHHPFYDHFGQAIDRTEASTRLGLDPTKRHLLFFGLIRPYKGVDVLLDAFAHLHGPYQLVIAGEPYGDREQLRRSAARHPKANDIVLMDRFIPSQEVALLFSCADAMVLPYRSATQSGVTAAAFQFGVPVVATDVGGLRETVKDGSTGVLVPEASPSAVAEGIERLFQLGTEHFRPAIAALRKDRSWSAFIAEVLDLANRTGRRG